MNMIDDQLKSPVDEPDGDGGTGVNARAGDKGPRTAILTFLAGLGIALVAGWGAYPALLYSEKEQPVQFNHQLHMAEVASGCKSCHYFREDGTFSGAPTLKDCTGCHECAIGESEEEMRFMEDYVKKGREVPWLIYSRQPDCVFFSHAAHVLKAGMRCEECHGPIGISTRLKPYRENRLTGYSRDIRGNDLAVAFKRHPGESMEMDDCARCHEKETGSKGACFQCHK